MNNEARQKSLSLLERTEYYDDKGEWRIAGSDWLLISGETLRNWVKVTEQALEPGATAIMYEVGKNTGEQFSKTLIEKGFKDRELKYAMEEFLTNGGWGKVWAKVNFQKQTAVVRIRNSVTTRQTKAKGPVCHVIGGYVAGVLGVMFGKKIECVETKCRAKGDAFCEFGADVSCQNEDANREKGINEKLDPSFEGEISIEKNAKTQLDHSSQEESLHILHVDDDASFLQVSKIILESENKFEIDTAISVDEAFDKLKTHSYDAVISDYEMPVKNGLDFLRELREQENSIAFIIFTCVDREVAIKALDLGADWYINKNSSPEMVYSELADIIRKLVNARKQAHTQ